MEKWCKQRVYVILEREREGGRGRERERERKRVRSRQRGVNRQCVSKHASMRSTS